MKRVVLLWALASFSTANAASLFCTSQDQMKAVSFYPQGGVMVASYVDVATSEVVNMQCAEGKDAIQCWNEGACSMSVVAKRENGEFRAWLKDGKVTLSTMECVQE